MQIALTKRDYRFWGTARESVGQLSPSQRPVHVKIDESSQSVYRCSFQANLLCATVSPRPYYGCPPETDAESSATFSKLAVLPLSPPPTPDVVVVVVELFIAFSTNPAPSPLRLSLFPSRFLRGQALIIPRTIRASCPLPSPRRSDERFSF